MVAFLSMASANSLHDLPYPYFSQWSTVCRAAASAGRSGGGDAAGGAAAGIGGGVTSGGGGASTTTGCGAVSSLETAGFTACQPPESVTLPWIFSLRARSFPVVGPGGVLVGVISREDVMRALGETSNALPIAV